jgi:hypothetical protein
MSKDLKRKNIPGELERKKLNGGGELVLVNAETHKNNDYYQIIFIAEGNQTNFVDNPSRYDSIKIEDAYDNIKTAGNFWEQRDEIVPDYDNSSESGITDFEDSDISD